MKRFLATAKFALILFLSLWLLVFLFSYQKFHDVQVAFAHICGFPILVKPSSILCTYSIPDEARRFEFLILNATQEQCIIYGLEGFCSSQKGCISGLDSYPLFLSPGQSQEIHVLYKTPKKILSSSVKLEPILYTSFGDQHLQINVVRTADSTTLDY